MIRQRADYLLVRRKSRWLAALWCAAVFACCVGLTGGVIALAFPLFHPLARWLRGEPSEGFGHGLWICGEWLLACWILVIASVTLKAHIRKRAGTYDSLDP